MKDPPSRVDNRPLDIGQFRRAAGQFPRGVALISSRFEDREHAVTASTFTVVSFPLRRVAVTLHRASRLTALIQCSGMWGVSLLADGDVPLAEHFATAGRPLGEMPRWFPCRRGPVTQVALLDGAPALLECRSVSELDADDHLIFLGEVVWAVQGDTDAAPLCDFRGVLSAFGSRSEQAQEEKR